jgi:A/G-specific adenine glycosylase
MLQQTQVETVVPYYQRFMKRLPTVQILARARLDTVLKLWEGLGYYSRARNMHRAAQMVCRDFKGVFPRDVEGLKRLPGIGQYSAGAIASIAYNQPEALVDGNVARVLCRVYRLHVDPKSHVGQEQLWGLARGLLAPRSAGAFNQGLMELGALVCRPEVPSCQFCPLRNQCQAYLHGEQEILPLRKPGKKTPLYHIAVGVIFNRGQVLIDRRPPKGLLGGLWEFPGGKREKGESLKETVVREVQEELGIKVSVLRKFMVIDHAYSHFRIRLNVFLCDYQSGTVQCRSCTAFRWVSPQQLRRYAFPTANKRIIDRLLDS